MNIKRNFFWKYRPLCVMHEVIRYCWHKSLGSFIGEPCCNWYNFGAPCQSCKKEHLEINKNWYRLPRPLYLHEHVFYNIDNAVKANPDLKGLALIFFMGLGDYLYTTPMLEALKAKFPKLKFYAYVSKNTDRNNSKFVASLLETNPNIEKVFYFDGYRNPVMYKNYNYDDAFKDIPEDFLAVPVLYEYGLETPHRTYSLFKTFTLPFPWKKDFPRPVFYFPKEPAQQIQKTYGEIHSVAKKRKGIVFLQLDSRGSAYTYPKQDDLIRYLLRKDYFVLTVTPSAVIDDNFKLLDIKKFSFNESCHLLDLLKKEHKLYIISLNSVFWAASAGLDIPNLGLQHWIDKKVHNLWYPNITVVTDYIYKKLPKNKMMTAKETDYTRHNKKIINYKPEFIIKCFDRMLAKLEEKSENKHEEKSAGKETKSAKTDKAAELQKV